MLELMDIKAGTTFQTFDPKDDLWQTVIVHQDRTDLLYQSPYVFRARREAEDFALRINKALFAARCPCGVSAQFVADFGNLWSDETDMNAYCSPECRDLADTEYDALERAGL